MHDHIVEDWVLPTSRDGTIGRMSKSLTASLRPEGALGSRHETQIFCQDLSANFGVEELGRSLMNCESARVCLLFGVCLV